MFPEKYTSIICYDNNMNFCMTQFNDENMWINPIFHIFLGVFSTISAEKHQKSIEQWSSFLIKK